MSPHRVVPGAVTLGSSSPPAEDDDDQRSLISARIDASTASKAEPEEPAEPTSPSVESGCSRSFVASPRSPHAAAEPPHVVGTADAKVAREEGAFAKEASLPRRRPSLPSFDDQKPSRRPSFSGLGGRRPSLSSASLSGAWKLLTQSTTESEKERPSCASPSQQSISGRCYEAPAFPNVPAMLADQRQAILQELEKRHDKLIRELDPALRAYLTMEKLLSSGDDKCTEQQSNVEGEECGLVYSKPSVSRSVTSLPVPGLWAAQGSQGSHQTASYSGRKEKRSNTAASGNFSLVVPEARRAASKQSLGFSEGNSERKQLTKCHSRIASLAVTTKPGLMVRTGSASQRLTEMNLSWLGRIVSSSHFESFFAMLILLNCLVMAAELQCTGMVYGNFAFEFDYIDLSRAPEIFVAIEWIFGTLFTLEWLLRIAGLGRYYIFSPAERRESENDSMLILNDLFDSPETKAASLAARTCKFALRCIRAVRRLDFWALLDTLIVVMWVLTSALESDNSKHRINPTFLRLVRTGKLLRMLRLVRAIRGFDSLYLLTTTLRSSGSALCWSILLLVLVQAIIAFVMCQVLGQFYVDENNPYESRRLIYLYFGTFSRAMLTMFELALGNWVPVSRDLMEKVSEFYVLFILFHKCVIGFAVVNVINGVFLQKTFAVAAADDQIMMTTKARAAKMHALRMKRLFESADSNNNGVLDREEFRDAMQDPILKDWLSAMEIQVVDEDAFFDLISCGDGCITQQELEQETARLKGNARSVDVELRFLEVAKLLARQQESLEALERRLDP
eukprot:TRINITY_DN31125_c0_g1_i1.p1 TRINITY_DN31125_c0_g1~~TRINITY_DN31125_c0_g1_i1.p1  ORF type:complete len:791 (+),score=154.01 TRINITY_DN31125_c0_g1_i1:87-2459(+)